MRLLLESMLSVLLCLFLLLPLFLVNKYRLFYKNSKHVCFKKPHKIWGLVSLTDLFDSNAWQCHSATLGPRWAAGILEAGAAGKLTGRHASARQGGPGEQGTHSEQVRPGSPKQPFTL